MADQNRIALNPTNRRGGGFPWNTPTENLSDLT
jgi:hypothetical protein